MSEEDVAVLSWWGWPVELGHKSICENMPVTGYRCSSSVSLEFLHGLQSLASGGWWMVTWAAREGTPPGFWWWSGEGACKQEMLWLSWFLILVSDSPLCSVEPLGVPFTSPSYWNHDMRSGSGTQRVRETLLSVVWLDSESSALLDALPCCWLDQEGCTNPPSVWLSLAS